MKRQVRLSQANVWWWNLSARSDLMTAIGKRNSVLNGTFFSSNVLAIFSNVAASCCLYMEMRCLLACTLTQIISKFIVWRSPGQFLKKISALSPSLSFLPWKALLDTTQDSQTRFGCLADKQGHRYADQIYSDSKELKFKRSFFVLLELSRCHWLKSG